jgi:UDP-2-acetamido-2,6-beta-L-arabino-hexul-4-ose reductase
MKYKIRELKKNIDDRGTLVEVLRSDEVGEFNQIYSATIKPGKMRGGHYHKDRKEWFCILTGEGIYKIKDIDTGEEIEIPIREGEFKQIELEPGLYHEIYNTGEKDLIFVSAISDLYDKNNSDTYKI